MRANTWGFLNLAVAVGALALTGVLPTYAAVLPYLPLVAAFFVMCSIVSFCWPVGAHEQRLLAVRDWKTPIEAIEAFGTRRKR